jgi:ferritin-like metal-binding protein YciE
MVFQVGSERAKPGECQSSGAELLLRRRETQPQSSRRRKAMAIKTMDDLFIHALQDVYYAENQIAKILPEMMDKVTDSSLFDHLERHLDETREHIKRLEQIFQALGQTPRGVTCQAVLGLIEEGQELVREIDDNEVQNAAILASVQAIEYYQINRYGTLIAWAQQLGHRETVDQKAMGKLEIVDLLQLNLDEEKYQDANLTALAESKVNRRAA